MSILVFSDGVTIDTSGKPRKLKLEDGWYCVGGGMCIPLDNEQQAEFLVDRMKDWDDKEETVLNSAKRS